MSTPNKRRETDIMKLMMSDYHVKMEEDSLTAFHVLFKGPKESLYEGGVWKVRVEIPPNYPYKSPSIGFANRIFHPNVDEASGSVCLDVINQTWSPMFDLLNVFEVFLPQLLLYPNPSDPLNGTAAAMHMRDPEGYKAAVKSYVQKYASPALVQLDADNHRRGGEGEDELSDLEDGPAQDDGNGADEDLVFD
eukprot:TRINITY_DN1687_c0_g1_i2.p1 TRINITY_DN1687_c0_g1~~TRINITY_DN1687_c0_g1_i2.p1  ORF type:complete len:192 (+),score=42.57 TRINITY_DN1687_c0_g1_i2:180-755(+)